MDINERLDAEVERYCEATVNFRDDAIRLIQIGREAGLVDEDEALDVIYADRGREDHDPQVIFRLADRIVNRWHGVDEE